ncbi:hypothetical protein REPUB_Repub15cG0003900 [Reevesia pubescens]
MQQPTSMAHSQQSGIDLVHQQQGRRFQNQMGPSIMQSNMPHSDLNIGCEDNLNGRAGNDYINSIKDGPMMGPQQPLQSAIPMEMRVSGMPPQNAIPDHGGGFNSMAGHAMHNLYGHVGPPYLDNALMRPLFVGSADTANLSTAEAYRKQHEVIATGENIPAPFTRFEDTGFPPEILREIHSTGFSCPTPIQAQTWPIALQSRDIVAKTGFGNTFGYLIPAIILLRQRCNNPQNGPTMLVLAPTRELATQIQEEAKKFGRSSRVSYTIRKIVNEIPLRRQTLMYTATWPKEVRKIASDLLVNPVQVNTGSVDELAANKAIIQYVEVVPRWKRRGVWHRFSKLKNVVQRLCDQLPRGLGRNFGAVAFHGDKSKNERDWVLSQFRSGKSPILVATDVASRELDVKDIRVVINYDFPTGIEDYVHRIRITGRAGATGVSFTFFFEQD